MCNSIEAEKHVTLDESPFIIECALTTFSDSEVERFSKDKIEKIAKTLAAVIAKYAPQHQVDEIKTFIHEHLKAHIKQTKMNDAWSYYAGLGEFWKYDKRTNDYHFDALECLKYVFKNFLTSDVLNENFHTNFSNFSLSIGFTMPVANITPVGMFFKDDVVFNFWEMELPHKDNGKMIAHIHQVISEDAPIGKQWEILEKLVVDVFETCLMNGGN